MSGQCYRPLPPAPRPTGRFVTDAEQHSRTRADVLYGICAGMFFAIVITTLGPPAMRYALDIPDPVPASALQTCEERLERYAEVGTGSGMSSA